MEIERKFLVRELPPGLESFPHLSLEQAYLCVSPVIRIRREGEAYVLTYKGSGMLAREEYNLPLTEEAYHHLLPKADGNLIAKTRYRIPLGAGYEGLTAELDVFKGKFSGLILVEVEFPDLETAESFLPPDWFGEDVTYSEQYHNSWLSRQ